jgi:acyl transferase domain-containing protein
VAAFDATAFGLSAPEAAMMDPQQRLVMELGGAGVVGDPQQRLVMELGSSSLSSSSQPRSIAPMSQDVGVFVGVSTTDYADLKKAHTTIGVYSATGKATAGSRVMPDRQTGRQHTLCHGRLRSGCH